MVKNDGSSVNKIIIYLLKGSALPSPKRLPSARLLEGGFAQAGLKLSQPPLPLSLHPVGNGAPQRYGAVGLTNL